MQAARPEGEDNRMPDKETAPDAVIREFVARSGLVPGDVSTHFTALTGGVASDIWKVEAGGQVFVVKKALSRLRVAREWTAPVSRNASEVDWLVTAGAVVPDAVPKVLAHDEQAGAFAMEFLDPAEYPVWKAELQAGHAIPAFAAQVGKALAAIHNATAGDETVARRFANDAVFHAIRLEPYLEATALLHPQLSDALMALSRDTLATKRALVHGDVSPKNILVGPLGPIFLDAECAWYGDPAFDLAFCLNHMLLKMFLARAAQDSLRACFVALASAYLDAVSFERREDIEARAARLLPGLLLGRVDGKSPVEYLTEEADKERVRRAAASLIVHPPQVLSAVINGFVTELAR